MPSAALALSGGSCKGFRTQQREGHPVPRRRAVAAAAAAGSSSDGPAHQQPQPRREGKLEFDIVSGSQVQQAQGPSCDWPRAVEQKRWQVGAVLGRRGVDVLLVCNLLHCFTKSTDLRALQEAILSTTGFPVPTGFGSGAAAPPPAGSGMLWRLRNPPREGPPTEPPAVQRRSGRAPAGSSAGSEGQRPPLVPVFRAAPYSAEAARQRRQLPTARILFLDDGCSCRAVLAQALMAGMLRWVLRGGVGVERSCLRRT